MMKTTPFELNQAVARWRRDLESSPAVGRDSADEIETHLRESISNLERQSLSTEEAFLVATKRFGRADAVQTEFQKVHPSAIWIDRGLWTLIGVQIWLAVSSLSGSAFSWLVVQHHSQREGNSGAFLYEALIWIVAMAEQLLPVAAVLGFVCWILPKHKNESEGPLKLLLTQPGKLMFVMLFVAFVCSACSFLASIHLTKTSGASTNIWPAYALQMAFTSPSKLMLAVGTFLLARKRLAKTA